MVQNNKVAIDPKSSEAKMTNKAKEQIMNDYYLNSNRKSINHQERSELGLNADSMLSLFNKIPDNKNF